MSEKHKQDQRLQMLYNAYKRSRLLVQLKRYEEAADVSMRWSGILRTWQLAEDKLKAEK